MLAIRTALAQEYLAEHHPSTRRCTCARSHSVSYFAGLLFNCDWAEHTEAGQRRWRDTQPGAVKHRRALKRIRAAVAHDAREARAA
jgi:hypothetical protein